MKRTRLYWQSILIVAFAAVGTLFAAQTGDALKIPGDFKHWYLVHSNAHHERRTTSLVCSRAFTSST